MRLPREINAANYAEYKRRVNEKDLDPNTEDQYEALENKLYGFGFKDYEVELIMERFVLGTTLGDITERYGYISAADVDRLLGRLKLVLKALYSKGE